MLIHFYLKYSTVFGQSIVLKYKKTDAEVGQDYTDLPLSYLNEHLWHGVLETNDLEVISYHYSLTASDYSKSDEWQDRFIKISAVKSEFLEVYDDWQNESVYDSVFSSRAFENVFNDDTKSTKYNSDKHPTHIFNLHAIRLPDHKVFCMSGSSSKLRNWDLHQPLFLKNDNGLWSISLDLFGEKFPLEYKFCIYDTKNKSIEQFEEGYNRILISPAKENILQVFNHCADFSKMAWRGAGVNVQLSSLKSKNSWGIGDFSDLNLLSDWSAAAGIKMIQLLPINDTAATHTRKDSYPYSANSVFALHPIFLNVSKLANSFSIEIPEEVLHEIKTLNEHPTLDYEKVSALKWKTIIELFEKEKENFEKDDDYLEFFSANRYWLEPYAAFCYLRDKHRTADFSKWKSYALFSEEKIKKLTGKKSSHYHEIAIHYFVQFHLHLQLSEAVSYAHKHDIILKGDLPIGVGRHSVDTWMSPDLFHMDMQAGAPPDAFARKGQNWSFPTYNWEAMKKDNYLWWGKRMKHMSNYFDAIRIDHVLGFFRIWSIPLHAIEGIFGVFEPSLALQSGDFSNKGIHFDEERYCQPFINDEILKNFFSEKSSLVRQQFLNNGKLKDEFNNQEKIQHYAALHTLDPDVKNGLFELLANVILLKDAKHSNQYHFRISMQETDSFRLLPQSEQVALNELYYHYFFERQNDLWYQVAQNKLDVIQHSSDMLICAEDLGMVPDMVEGVLKSRQMLALQVQRMPKKSYEDFSHPANAPYLSVVTPSTHDMSTIRQWWEEDRKVTQRFYSLLLGHNGEAPYFCEPHVCKEIINQHLQSPAMWSVFLLQDLLSVNDKIRREDIHAERINIPANPDHYWNYRMHLNLESLINNKSFTKEIREMIQHSGRL